MPKYNKLKAAIVEAAGTQREFARRNGFAEVRLSEIIRGKGKVPDLRELRLLADGLQVDQASVVMLFMEDVPFSIKAGGSN